MTPGFKEYVEGNVRSSLSLSSSVSRPFSLFVFVPVYVVLLVFVIFSSSRLSSSIRANAGETCSFITLLFLSSLKFPLSSLFAHFCLSDLWVCFLLNQATTKQ